jgi:hypothetical protein
MDEHDHEEPLLEVLDDGSLLVDARLEVEKLGAQLKMDLPEGDFESVGGFIIHIIGRIPEVNEKVSFQEIEMTIKKGDQRKIEKVLISRKDAPRFGRGGYSSRFRRCLTNLNDAHYKISLPVISQSTACHPVRSSSNISLPPRTPFIRCMVCPDSPSEKH